MDYYSYYPITLPMRRPYAGDPEVLDVEKFMQASGNHEESLNTAANLGLEGELREFWEMVQTEVVDGELLQDCLEVGSNDLKSWLQIAKDMSSFFFQFCICLVISTTNVSLLKYYVLFQFKSLILIIISKNLL